MSNDADQPWIALAELERVARRFREELRFWNDDQVCFVATTDGRLAYWEDVRAFE
jgi:hypothetical protein